MKLQTIDHYYEQGEDQEVGHKEGMLTIEITTQTMIMIIKEEEQTRITTTNKTTTQMNKMTMNNKIETQRNRDMTERKRISRTKNKGRENKDRCKS